MDEHGKHTIFFGKDGLSLFHPDSCAHLSTCPILITAMRRVARAEDWPREGGYAIGTNFGGSRLLLENWDGETPIFTPSRWGHNDEVAVVTTSGRDDLPDPRETEFWSDAQLQAQRDSAVNTEHNRETLT